jgi:hypothetical protein
MAGPPRVSITGPSGPGPTSGTIRAAAASAAGRVSCIRISSRLGRASSSASLTIADMLRERTLAASRSRRATYAANRGVIFTVSSIRVLSGSTRRGGGTAPFRQADYTSFTR